MFVFIDAFKDNEQNVKNLESHKFAPKYATNPSRTEGGERVKFFNTV